MAVNKKITSKGIRWKVDVTENLANGKQKRHKATFEDQTEALIYEKQLKQALQKGSAIPQGISSGAVASTQGMGLEKSFQRTFMRYWDKGRSEEKQIQISNMLFKFFGNNESIANITTQRINDFIVHLKSKRNSNGTINRKLACLSKILRHAFREGRLSQMPHFDRLTEGNNRIRWIDYEEEDLILDRLNSWGKYDIRDAYIVSVDVGCRAGELVRIKRNDITKEGLYIGDRKNDNPCTVPLTNRARNTLEIRSKTTNGDYLFPYKDYWYRNTFERLVNNLNLDDVCWHTLRHTCASRLVQGNMPLIHVKEWMGHKSIQTTMRYAHLAPKHLAQGINVLERKESTH